MRVVLIFILAIFLFPFSSISQTYDPGKIDKKLISLLEEAHSMAEVGDFNRAISLAKNALEKDKNFLDAWVFLGFVYSTNKLEISLKKINASKKPIHATQNGKRRSLLTSIRGI